jgi:actin-like protein 6A
MFEKNGSPAVFLSKDVVLSCFSCGRTSGLLVDAGASGAVVIPVQDGWADMKGLNRSVVGGRMLDAFLVGALKKQGINPKPSYRVRKVVTSDNAVVATDINVGPLSPSFDAWSILEIGRNLKESVCRTSDSPIVEGDTKYANLPLLPYELPDGTHVDVGYERFLPAELYFDPSGLDIGDPLVASLNLSPASNSNSQNLFSSVEALPRLVVDSILRSENVDAQASLCGNIIVTGGGACLDGLTERLKAEVEKIVYPTSATWKVRSISAGMADRPINAWLGGSILASLGTFHEMWFSKKEYDEFGPTLVDRKCP